MGSGSINIVFETSHAVVAVWQQVIVLAVREQFSAPAWQAAAQALDTRSGEMASCLLSVFGERAQLPDSATVTEGVRTLHTGRAVCRARVVLGQGMRPGATRYVLEKAEEACADQRPHSHFSRIPDASEWLGKQLGKDTAWRLTLATLAGTLLYGTPSYSRRSQVARYLAGDEEGKDPNGDWPKRKT